MQLRLKQKETFMEITLELKRICNRLHGKETFMEITLELKQICNRLGFTDRSIGHSYEQDFFSGVKARRIYY